jgi:hypothetical protein
MGLKGFYLQVAENAALQRAAGHQFTGRFARPLNFVAYWHRRVIASARYRGARLVERMLGDLAFGR